MNCLLNSTCSRFTLSDNEFAVVFLISFRNRAVLCNISFIIHCHRLRRLNTLDFERFNTNLCHLPEICDEFIEKLIVRREVFSKTIQNSRLTSVCNLLTSYLRLMLTFENYMHSSAVNSCYKTLTTVCTNYFILCIRVCFSCSLYKEITKCRHTRIFMITTICCDYIVTIRINYFVRNCLIVWECEFEFHFILSVSKTNWFEFQLGT